MCLVVFKRHPCLGLRWFFLFNRDEQLRRPRSSFRLHWGRVLCAVDLHTGGTWFGLNLHTGNLGFLTNFAGKPGGLQRARLITDFLCMEHTPPSEDYFRAYLEPRFRHGMKGTNVWLTNLRTSELIVYAHNQHSKVEISLVSADTFHAYGNTAIEEDTPKQALARVLCARAFDLLPASWDLIHLKELLFAVAECNRAWDWAQVPGYRAHEAFEHGSLFVDKHLLWDQWYATVSSTLLLVTDSGRVYVFERVYDHTREKDVGMEEEARLAIGEA